jgi:hypothetical protein
MNANTLNDVFEDLEFLSRLMDDIISDTQCKGWSTSKTQLYAL